MLVSGDKGLQKFNKIEIEELKRQEYNRNMILNHRMKSEMLCKRKVI